MANEGEATATVIDHDDGQSVIVDIPSPEVTGSEAVEIARIEAAVEEHRIDTNAAVELAAIEQRGEINEELTTLRERNTWLEAELTNMQERNREMEAEIARLTPPPSPPEEAAEVVAVLEPENLTTDMSETQTGASSSTQTEAPASGEDAEAVEEAEAVVTPPVAALRKVRFL